MKIHAHVLMASLVILLSVQQSLSAQYPVGAPYPSMGYGPMAPADPMMMMMAAGGPMGMADPGLVAQASYQSGCSDCGDASCSSASCNGGCAGGCCNCGWCYRFSVFGEFLYLRARDAEVAYGVPIDGPIVAPPANPVQVGPIGVVDQDYDPGFRLGFTYVLDQYSTVSMSYSMFETGRSDSISTSAPDVIRSLVTHPGTLNSAQDWLSATAQHDITFDLIDLDYRGMFACCDSYEAVVLVGARYANLEQQFVGVFTETGSETVTTDIDFDGVGLRVGLEGKRFSPSRRLHVYGKTAASLLAGEFRTSYNLSRTFDTTVVDTSWEAGRLVPILDVEVGAGWSSKCDTWHLSAGYVFSAWFNTVKTDEWIQAVGQNNFVDMSDGITFDGLVARIEGRF